MKQLIQHIRTGQAEVVDVPAPDAGSGQVLVQTAASLVSAGTERMVVDFAEKNLLEKARARPDLVRQTVDKARREGLLTTFEAVQNRLDQPMALGYSSAGRVIDVGAGITGFQVGDRVACAGGGYAAHAEVVAVPKNLVVLLPDSVDFESAAFTTIGAIALQGIRLADVRLGEIIAVVGLGLLGQLSVQMLKAAGCTVIGMDIQPQRAELAQKLGASAAVASADELRSLVLEATDGHGADVVLITADTKSNQPVELAGELVRKKGVVVAVGAVGMNIPRKVYYEKELDFRISSSYGPGRYDANYEEKGQDYPLAYVRWTENRNMQAFVNLQASGSVDVKPLITQRFPIAHASAAYDLITGKSGESFLGVLLTYPDTSDLRSKIILRNLQPRPERRPLVVSRRYATRNTQTPSTLQRQQLDKIRLGVLGAGNFANSTILPALKGMGGVEFVGIASSGGLSARTTAGRFGFRYCTSDVLEILDDSDINTVAILTRHNLHANQVIAALEAGKNVFVEKPLCLTEQELQAILAAYQSEIRNPKSENGTPYLMVGFNRRFAPFIVELKQHLQTIAEPLVLNFRVNAGYISSDHWTQDPEIGGERLLGEGCHFVDLLIYLAGFQVVQVSAQSLPDVGKYHQDNFVMQLHFANGSLGILTYVANGDSAFGKEFLEVFGGGLSARLDNYRTLKINAGKQRTKRTARLRQDKGHRAEWQVLTAYLTQGGTEPMSLAEIVHSTEVTLAAYRSLQDRELVQLREGNESC